MNQVTEGYATIGCQIFGLRATKREQERGGLQRKIYCLEVFSVAREPKVRTQSTAARMMMYKGTSFSVLARGQYITMKDCITAEDVIDPFGNGEERTWRE